MRFFMKRIYIGIGSNLGDPGKNCLEAIERIGKIPKCSILGISNLYRTEPMGVEDQEWFINGAIVLSADLSPRYLLERLLAIEADMGRVRNGKHWGPRVIDLDILLFGRDIIHEENLFIPHPYMHERRFVLIPMIDLDPDLEHPLLGKSMSELLRAIPEDGQIVKQIEGT
jgi:2-amino-4-hydroxy-6-hydroxymethyldihydropteridine diphosphokinase